MLVIVKLNLRYYFVTLLYMYQSYGNSIPENGYCTQTTNVLFIDEFNVINEWLIAI